MRTVLVPVQGQSNSLPEVREEQVPDTLPLTRFKRWWRGRWSTHVLPYEMGKCENSAPVKKL
jgi:hypothetical protein